jgi:hypothetical protein
LDALFGDQVFSADGELFVFGMFSGADGLLETIFGSTDGSEVDLEIART